MRFFVILIISIFSPLAFSKMKKENNFYFTPAILLGLGLNSEEKNPMHLSTKVMLLEYSPSNHVDGLRFFGFGLMTVKNESIPAFTPINFFLKKWNFSLEVGTASQGNRLGGVISYQLF